MSNPIRITLVILLCLLVAVPAVAQEEEQTCDDALNAAQTSYEAGELETAQEQVEQAVVLCDSDRTQLREAKRLRASIEKALRQKALDDKLAEAVPGKVDVGDYTLFMTCRGEGSPTIIFETGFGGPSEETWRKVIEPASKLTRACQYDRLGLGYSDPMPTGAVRTTQDQVDDLAALLEIGRIEPPYILVGHSMAGLNVALFTHQYPDSVAGIVLIDVVHPDQWAQFAEYYPEEIAQELATPLEPENLDVATSITQVSDVNDFGDRPLVVITALAPETDAVRELDNQIWLALQEDYATYSTNSRHIVLEDTDHMVMLTDPDMVIEAIQWVLDEIAKSNSSGASSGRGCPC